MQTERVRTGSTRIERYFFSDAVVSDVPGMHFLVTCADCVPLLFHDPVQNVLGAAHAGWRGTAARIGPETVRAMVDIFGSQPSDIRVGVGPSVGPCCYSVGREVLGSFARHGAHCRVEEREGSTFLDLWSSNEIQLRECGVQQVEHAHVCTSCNTDMYFSHRAEAGLTGRFALVAGLAA